MIVILVKRLFRRLKHWRQRHPQIGRDTVVGIVIFAFLVILAQILYPSDRLLPSIKAQGFEIGGQRLTKAQEALAKHYEKATITVVAGNKTFTQSLAQIGVEIDRTATVQKASEYSLYQR